MHSEIRRPVMSLVLGIVAVHAVAIAAFYALGITSRPASWRYAFGGAWIALTLVIVLKSLAALRTARIRRRRAR
jgi:uncharacterized BrkB/YihY/UPF0761 family membrane protein